MTPNNNGIPCTSSIHARAYHKNAVGDSYSYIYLMHHVTKQTGSLPGILKLVAMRFLSVIYNLVHSICISNQCVHSLLVAIL